MLPIANILIAFVATGASIYALKPVAAKIGLLDIPGGRKTHIDATPLVGGLGIFIGILVMSVLTTDTFSNFRSFLSLSALILFIGTIDDAKDLTPAVRTIGHSLVALVMAIVAEIQLTSFGELLFSGNFQLGVLSVPITIFATVGVINAINMSDGIDGLSGSTVAVALGFIAWMSYSSGDLISANFIVVIICSILAFLTLPKSLPPTRDNERALSAVSLPSRVIKIMTSSLNRNQKVVSVASIRPSSRDASTSSHPNWFTAFNARSYTASSGSL